MLCFRCLSKMFPCACKTLLRTQIVLENTIHRSLSSGYRSKISLETLYPKSEQEKNGKGADVTSQVSDKERFSGVIPLDELQFQYCLSSGAGGQNVNKVNTKVEVRFNIDKASWIPEWIKPKLKEQQQNRVTKDGDFVVRSEKTRKQILNQADCLDKIRHMIFQASVLPKELTPEQKAIIKEREEAANRRRLEDKKRRSLLKARRQLDA
ncbi:peptidyl-tRNA hydrolase ICT1, mitochondrial-like [Mercenaria mercenaria]|uniref:peptidyl-tRNA hydrolase ICT1, mitochondrial-like n=1 Tax=Mercenaria mercenaria TaxID=6596 RepID=UPI00234E7774|nr:peptidyl-tRNA hydrolase ICT1, mitochondrial-like [Mercenaria mercenaria]